MPASIPESVAEGVEQRGPSPVRRRRSWALFCALLFFTVGAPVHAGTKCTMIFSLEGWSAFYKTAEGSGRVTCDDGSAAKVRLSAKGGGLTFGINRIEDGDGTFSEIPSIDDIYGSYAVAEAHAGAGTSSSAQVLTRGDVSLTLHGRGSGVDIGFSFGRLNIDASGDERPKRLREEKLN